jgi:hypothetical protein
MTRDTGDAHRGLRLVSETCRNAGDMARRASWCVDAATIIFRR